MDSELKSFLIGKAVSWAQRQLGIRDVEVVIDENAPADVWGQNVLSWYLELLVDYPPGYVSIEVDIDPDGYVSVGRLETAGPQLKHLWPDKS